MNLLDPLRLVIIVATLVVFSVWMKRHPTSIRSLSPRYWWRHARELTMKDYAKKLGIGLAFALVAFLLLPDITSFVESNAGPIVDNPAQNPIAIVYRISPLMLLAVSVVLPISEEWLFRDVMLPAVRRKYGAVIAVLISSATFAFLHITNPGTSPLMFIPVLAGGVMFSLAYLRGGLLSSYLAHGVYNALVVLSVM